MSDLPRAVILDIVVGRGLCRTFRHYLKRQQFLGIPVTWLESSGWFEREFTIKVPGDHATRIRGDLIRWAKQLEMGTER